MKRILVLACTAMALGALMNLAGTPGTSRAEEAHPPIVLDHVPVIMWEDTNRDGYFGSSANGLSGTDTLLAGPDLTHPVQPAWWGGPLDGGGWGLPFPHSDHPKPAAVVIGPVNLSMPEARYLMGGIWKNNSPSAGYLTALPVKIWQEIGVGGGASPYVLDPNDTVLKSTLTDDIKADYCMPKVSGYDTYGIQIELRNAEDFYRQWKYSNISTVDGQIWGWDSSGLGNYAAICNP